jgi:hypothetical protein
VAALPATGVYRYRTSGQESIDALGGTSHGYPSTTTITVVAAGCGVTMRWDLLVERREVWSLCATARGVELQPDAEQYHEFYGQPDDEALHCDAAVLLLPAPGMATTGPARPACTLGGDPWAPVWEVLERSTRSVGGSEVAVVHVRMTVEVGAPLPEHTVVDWFLAPSGLPVGITVAKRSVSSSPVGDVTYVEQAGATLHALDPLR